MCSEGTCNIEVELEDGLKFAGIIFSLGAIDIVRTHLGGRGVGQMCTNACKGGIDLACACIFERMRLLLGRKLILGLRIICQRRFRWGGVIKTTVTGVQKV